MNDRTVHARSEWVELVRYDRAGKWWVEARPKGQPRRPTTMNEVVEIAARMPEIFYGRHGGNTFDRRVRARVGDSGSTQKGNRR